MRTALLDRSLKSRGVNSATANIPAPVGGWNTRDSLAEMPPLDAPTLDNWFPRASQLVLRGGSASFATGMTGTVKTLMQYAPASGTRKLYAATDSGIYDITAGGAIGAVVQALTNGYFNSINLANSAGTSFLWGCNGTDTPKMWNGAAWSTPALTGIATPANLVYPLLFKHRIFAIEKNSMNVWYLPIDSIQGLMAVLPYGNLLYHGGSLTAMASWTLDSGSGSDDLFAVVSSEGDLAIYQGIDPSSASSWALVGVWQVGKPLGRRCFQKLAGDVTLLTENGVFPLSRLLKSGNINYATALSNKIQPTFTAATQAVGINTAGWESCVVPQWDALITNVPASPPVQYVMNTVTGKWCSFSGWSANCFQVYQGTLYYGLADGIVNKAWDGVLASDSGFDITAVVRTAYNYFGAKTQLKQVTLFRPLLNYNGGVAQSWAISPDYANVTLSSSIPRNSSQVGSLWNTILWNTHFWSSVGATFKLWRAASHVPGYALALWLQIATNNATVSWSGTDYILKQGGQM